MLRHCWRRIRGRRIVVGRCISLLIWVLLVVVVILTKAALLVWRHVLVIIIVAAVIVIVVIVVLIKVLVLRWRSSIRTLVLIVNRRRLRIRRHSITLLRLLIRWRHHPSRAVYRSLASGQSFTG